MSNHGTSHHEIGKVVVTRVVEQCGPGLTPGYLFPEWEPGVVVQQPQHFIPRCYDAAEGKLISSVHSWIVRTQYHTILIDTCTGNHKHRPAQPRAHGLETLFLQRLAAKGIAPEIVDFVICTHLHAHHCGWNTKLVNGRWLPTFPNAKYVFSKVENDHGAIGNPGINAGVYEDSILPLFNAGQALVVDGPCEVVDNLVLHPTPGHSPGHLAIQLFSLDKEAIFCGDIMHHPVQAHYPSWNSRFCEDPGTARESRRWLLEHAANRHAVLFTSHFPLTSAGHVNQKGEQFNWSYLSCGKKENLKL